jgi:hypothetical protein
MNSPYTKTKPIDDQPLNKIRLDNISLNPGVLSTLFNAPESLLTNE